MLSPGSDESRTAPPGLTGLDAPPRNRPVRSPLRVLLFLTLPVAALIPGTGCHSPRVRDRPFAAIPVVRGGVTGLVPRLPAASAADALTFRAGQAASEAPGGAMPGQLLALADLADTIGTRTLVSNPAAALPWLRDAAVYAAFALQRRRAQQNRKRRSGYTAHRPRRLPAQSRRRGIAPLCGNRPDASIPSGASSSPPWGW